MAKFEVGDRVKWVTPGVLQGREGVVIHDNLGERGEGTWYGVRFDNYAHYLDDDDDEEGLDYHDAGDANLERVSAIGSNLLTAGTKVTLAGTGWGEWRGEIATVAVDQTHPDYVALEEFPDEPHDFLISGDFAIERVSA